MNSENEFTGVATFEFSFVKKENEVCPFSDSDSINIWNKKSMNQLFIVINEGNVLIPIDKVPSDGEQVASTLNKWLNESDECQFIFRNKTMKTKDIKNKLLKLGFQIVKYTGDHCQMVREGYACKVTIPVGKGEISGRLLRDILTQLRQSDISWNTLRAV